MWLQRGSAAAAALLTITLEPCVKRGATALRELDRRVVILAAAAEEDETACVTRRQEWLRRQVAHHVETERRDQVGVTFATLPGYYPEADLGAARRCDLARELAGPLWDRDAARPQGQSHRRRATQRRPAAVLRRVATLV